MCHNSINKLKRMKNKKFLKENLGRIYMYKGLLVELVGYTDGYPGGIYIVRYLNPDKARARGEGWTFLDPDDVIAQGYYKPGIVYSYSRQGNLKQVKDTDAVRAFAEARKGEKFSLRYGWIVTAVGYSTGYVAVIVARKQGGWQRLGGADFILFNSEQKTFNYVDYRKLKPL